MDIRFRLSRSVPALVEFNTAVPGGAQTRLFPPPEDFTLSTLQQLTNAMQVGSHHRQRTCVLKSVTVSSDNWDESVDLGQPVRGTHLSARSIVLEIQTAATSIGVVKLGLMPSELRLPAMKQMWSQFAQRADTEGWAAAQLLSIVA